MENDLYSSPRRNCSSSGCLVRSAAVMASRRTFGVYAVPLTETICISGVMPALYAGLFHQTLLSSFVGPVGAAPRPPPTENPSEVEKSAPVNASSDRVSHDGMVSL